MTIKPSLHLHRERTGGNFIIQNFAEDTTCRGLKIACGKFVRMSAAEMKERGLEMVLTNLREFFKRDTHEKHELNDFSPAERRRFFRAYLAISISLPNDNTLELAPVRRDRHGGGSTLKDEVSLLKLLCTNQEFLCAVEHAYSLLD